jgi:hypothetical protein
VAGAEPKRCPGRLPAGHHSLVTTTPDCRPHEVTAQKDSKTEHAGKRSRMSGPTRYLVSLKSLSYFRVCGMVLPQHPLDDTPIEPTEVGVAAFASNETEMAAVVGEAKPHLRGPIE